MNIILSIIFLAVAILLLYLGNVVIKCILIKIDGNKDKCFDVPDGTMKLHNGSVIGFLERVLYFIGIVIQNWVLISLVIALKTIARYQELNDQDKAEYFLIGSLLSLLYSIIISMAFVLVFKLFDIPYLIEIHSLIVDSAGK